MNNQILTPVKLIDGNPYQPRHAEDPVAVVEIAESIKRNGLMQIPTARELNGRYQLAFGHTRLAAFKLNNEECMPLVVRDLSDLQMFELGVAENVKRRDLNPIELAESMRRYMDEFGKTSVEAGEFFNCSEENVRAKVRLLNLPATVQDKMREGEINETAARSLLTLTRVLPNNEEALLETVKEISEGEKPEEAVEQALRSNPNTKIIGNESDGHFSMKAKTFKYLPELTKKAAMEALDYQNNEWVQHAFAGYGQEIPDAINYFEVNVHYLAAHAQPELLIDKLNHLMKPPACTACPLFATIDGTGYCGWVACFDRKKEAHEEAELHRVSEAVGIAVYSKEDGAAMELRRWADKHQNAFNKKHADLRLRRSNSYNTWEGIPSYFAVVAVGNLYKTWKKADEQTKESNAAHEGNSGVSYERRRAMQQIRDAQISLFTWEQALPAFVKVLESVACIDLLNKIDDELISGDFLEIPDEADLSEKEQENLKKPARLALLRKRVVYKTLDSRMDWDKVKKIQESKTPVTLFAKYLQELATTWGVKLPKDFLTKAAEHDEAVKLEIAELDKPDKDGAE